MRLDTDKQKKLEPKRIQYAIEQIEKLGYQITFRNETTIKFKFKNSEVTLYPYSGWHSGKTIKDGRGIENLLKQIKE